MKIDGKKLKQARLQHLWTIGQAAKQLNVTEQTYIRWEKGTVQPHPGSLKRLCETFQLTPEQLSQPVEEQDITEDMKLKTASMLYDIVPIFSEGSTENQSIWNIPLSFTSFIGREQEVAALCSMLKREYIRLITLLGPGGIGKTRLSTHIAEQMHDAFADGVRFVPLANVDSPDLMLLMIAQALGIQKSRKQSLLEQIRFFLRDKHVLLILDSFEKLIAAAPVIETLLGYCPNLKILVTSRNKLYLKAEYEFSVPSLALPKSEDLANLDALTQLASVNLFVQRAQAVLPNFMLTSENAKVVAEICVRLDGLPLAIELAAARIKPFSPRALLERLSQSSQILKSHLWGLPERQQTLYNIVKWSYDLLDEQEQHLFRSLAVFQDGFTLDAVKAFYEILNPTLYTGEMLLEKILSLLDKSLIQMSGEAPRFSMLETIREYGLLFLEECGEKEECQQAHASYYLSMVEEAYPRLKGAQQKVYLVRLDPEMGNLKEALQSFIEFKNIESILRFSEALGKFYGLRGKWTEEKEVLREALDLSKNLDVSRSPESMRMRAKILRRAGYLAYRLRELGEAQTLSEECVNISREIGEKRELVGALITLGRVHYRQKSIETASRLLKEGVAIAREIKDKWVLANALDGLGSFMYFRGNIAEAHQVYQESTALARELSDRESLIRFLTTLVSIEIALGNIWQADIWAQESIALAQELDTKPLKALSYDSMAEVALFQGDYKKARKYFEQRMELALEIRDKPAVAIKRFRLGELALVLGAPEQAITPVQESLKFFQEKKDTPNIAAALAVLGDIKRKEGELEQAWRLYEEALQLDVELENKRNIGRDLVGLAKVVLEQGQTEKAARLFARAASYFEPRVDMYPAQRIDYEQAVEHARAQIGEKAFAELQSENANLKFEQLLKS
jgi:predicted ATPase/transcriptional regulator with XRE-family HTH domain